ncbi:hypothetical protein G6F32_016639 [Rhizopus arrhizus]|nr:hypothetical protein G6F32_016639 [Rhizopus arrhizus]
MPRLDAAPVPALPCNEVEARAYVAAFGLPQAMAPAARDAGEAVAQARAAGYPVALKILSPDIAHKTEAGGVALGLADDAAVQALGDHFATVLHGISVQARDGISRERLLAMVDVALSPLP